MTPDGKWLFVADLKGMLFQIDLGKGVRVGEYWGLHCGEGNILSMAVTQDSRFLYTSGRDNCIARIWIERQKGVGKWGPFDVGVRWDNTLTTIKLTPDEKGLFVWSNTKELMLVGAEDGRVIKNFTGTLWTDPFWGFSQHSLVTKSGKSLFTSWVGDDC